MNSSGMCTTMLLTLSNAQHLKMGFEEDLSVPLVFHMDSTKLQWTFSAKFHLFGLESTSKKGNCGASSLDPECV